MAVSKKKKSSGDASSAKPNAGKGGTKTPVDPGRVAPIDYGPRVGVAKEFGLQRPKK